MWQKKPNGKIRLFAALGVVLVLAAAFWYGGSAPGSRGWVLQNPEDSAATPEQPALSDPAPAAPAGQTAPAAPGRESSEPEETGKSEQPAEPAAPDQPVQPPAQHQPDGQAQDRQPEDSKSCTCTISISCATILDHLDWLDPEKQQLVPQDGWILPATQVDFDQGESAFQVLQRVCRENRIPMEFTDTPVYGSAYIEGIQNLYEFDCGQLSGWMYQVNGCFPNYGCSQYILSDGDVVGWVYTCDLGGDVGGSNGLR